MIADVIGIAQASEVFLAGCARWRCTAERQWRFNFEEPAADLPVQRFPARARGPRRIARTSAPNERTRALCGTQDRRGAGECRHCRSQSEEVSSVQGCNVRVAALCTILELTPSLNCYL